MPEKKVNIELLTDLAIKTENDDKFGRKDFVNAIADIIYSQSTEVNAEGEPVFKNVDENLIIGLYGSWGHGKSSVINLLDENLKKRGLRHQIHFNPWMYGSENQLIASLFQIIIKETTLKNGKEKELIDLFKKYFSLIQLVSPDIASYGEAILKTFDNVKEFDTAESIKSKIDSILLDTTNPITIFIDDVDRLSKDEIHVLFKTLRLIASFKHVIYVIAFDFEMVAKSIKEKYVDGNEEDGKAFLEKIVQIPIRIPEIEKETLTKFASELLYKSTGIKIDEFRIYKLIIENYYHTPRDIIRFVNAFKFSKHYFNGDLEDGDLLFLELVRNKMHDFFQMIKIYYLAISSINPHESFEKGLNEFIKINLPDMRTDKGNLNHQNKVYLLYNSLFREVFGTEFFYYMFQPLPASHINTGILTLEDYMRECKINPPESLKNPFNLVRYFEKSAEINQAEAVIEQ